jgi:hypothetical protein
MHKTLFSNIILEDRNKGEVCRITNYIIKNIYQSKIPESRKEDVNKIITTYLRRKIEQEKPFGKPPFLLHK